MAYLNTMFAALPNTPEIARLKQELLSGMEDKYFELKREGKSENEAIGIVISEFGNIEELTAELGIPAATDTEAKPGPNPYVQNVPFLSEAEAYGYAAAKRSAGLWSGVGVFLILLGVAFLIAMDTVFEFLAVSTGVAEETGTMLGVIGLLALIAVAVGLFIYGGMKLEGFKNLESSFQLDESLRSALQSSRQNYAPTYRFAIITGVCLSILSPGLIVATQLINDTLVPYSVVAFLLLISVAVFLFIYYGNIQSVYSKLLEESGEMEGNRHVWGQEKGGVVGAVGAVVWPLATVLFMVTGFVLGRWDINWLIFPVTGILFGMFSNVYRNVKHKDMA